ncbi:MAG: Holliday junction resolvase RuvX, partial [Pirellulaceae bacterium]|nr:Holliday junction resolvase RuvX [Pirellulaceae bacterium]
ENYTRRSPADDARWFQRLVQEEQVAGLVLGLPVHTSGQESQKSIEVQEFGRWLGELTGLPVCYFDERYTSTHAEALLLEAGMTSKRRKQRLDKLAAQIMLAAFLDSSRNGDPPGAL